MAWWDDAWDFVTDVGEAAVNTIPGVAATRSITEGPEAVQKSVSKFPGLGGLDPDKNKDGLFNLGGMGQPGEQEQALLDLIGEEGLKELQGLFTDGFQLDDSTRNQLDRLRETRLSGAREGLDYALDQATGRATAGAAGRGLSQGSLRTELQARLSDPAIARFQQQRFAIDESDAMQRLAMPRQDFALRQAALESPALTALQRNRLANAELRLRLGGLNEQRRARQSQEGSLFGDAMGALAGAGVDYIGSQVGTGSPGTDTSTLTGPA